MNQVGSGRVGTMLTFCVLGAMEMINEMAWYLLAYKGDNGFTELKKKSREKANRNFQFNSHPGLRQSWSAFLSEAFLGIYSTIFFIFLHIFKICDAWFFIAKNYLKSYSAVANTPKFWCFRKACMWKSVQGESCVFSLTEQDLLKTCYAAACSLSMMKHHSKHINQILIDQIYIKKITFYSIEKNNAAKCWSPKIISCSDGLPLSSHCDPKIYSTLHIIEEINEKFYVFTELSHTTWIFYWNFFQEGRLVSFFVCLFLTKKLKCRSLQEF